MDEGDLERRAVEELLKEAKRARVRAETMGPAGWMKCPLGSTNKRFLLNTLRSSTLGRRPGGQGATGQRGGEHMKERTQKKCHRESKDHSQRKDHKHKTDSSNLQRDHASSKGHTFRDEGSSRSHSPHRSNQSCRAHSRSPVRDMPRERSRK